MIITNKACWIVGLVEAIGRELPRSYKIRTKSLSLVELLTSVLAEENIEVFTYKSTKGYYHLVMAVDKKVLLCPTRNIDWLSGVLDSKAIFRLVVSSSRRQKHMEVSSTKESLVQSVVLILNSMGIRTSVTKTGSVYRVRVHRDRDLLLIRNLISDTSQLLNVDKILTPDSSKS